MTVTQEINITGEILRFFIPIALRYFQGISVRLITLFVPYLDLFHPPRLLILQP